jgi:hypothetical protein
MAIRVASGDNLAEAVASAPQNSCVVLESGGTFEVQAPIETATDQLTIDGQGAAVRIGTAPKGDTAKYDLFIRLTGTDQIIENLNFITGANRRNSEESRAANVRMDGTRGVLRGCTFATGSSQAVACTGSASSGNQIRENHITGSGIAYAWSGSCSTQVVRNIIDDAPANALEGIGDHAARYNDDCQIVDNVVRNAGRMGIEDRGKTRRTLIRGNLIERPASTAISARGQSAAVEGNKIVDAPARGWAVETTSDGNVVRDNTIAYRTVTPTDGAAIVINGSGGGAESAAIVSGNAVHGSYFGIRLAAKVTAVTITANIVTDARRGGISLMPDSAEAIACSSNTVRFDSPAHPSARSRDGVIVDAQCVNLLGNSIAYTMSSAGSATDYAIRAVSGAGVIVGNIIQGGGRTDANKPRMAAEGPSAAQWVISSNTFLGGAILDRDGFASAATSNNFTS